MKLIVDKLPSGCTRCLFYSGMYCPLLKQPAPDSCASRLKGCPLVMTVSPCTRVYLDAYGQRMIRTSTTSYISDMVVNNRVLLKTMNLDLPAGWMGYSFKRTEVNT